MAPTELMNPAGQDEQEDTLKGKYLIFSMGSELYGIQIRYITEIIGIQPITAVPDIPEYIKGITNLRGKIIPVMDARLRLSKAERAYDDRTCIIVLDNGGTSTGLIVDSVSEVMTFKEEEIAPPPEMGRERHKYIQGIGKAGGGVKLLLDGQRLIAQDCLEALSATA
jgi:purine-binding chemotaxis protein CheW